MSKAVTATLGPNGRNVVIVNDQGQVQSTKDGVTVAKNITLKDNVEEVGVKMVKQAAIKTANIAGDGTTTSTLLASEMVKAGLKHLNNGANAVEIKPSESLVNAVAMLAFGCLGLSSIDKIWGKREGENKEE